MNKDEENSQELIQELIEKNNRIEELSKWGLSLDSEIHNLRNVIDYERMEREKIDIILAEKKKEIEEFEKSFAGKIYSKFHKKKRKKVIDHSIVKRNVELNDIIDETNEYLKEKVLTLKNKIAIVYLGNITSKIEEDYFFKIYHFPNLLIEEIKKINENHICLINHDCSISKEDILILDNRLKNEKIKLVIPKPYLKCGIEINSRYSKDLAAKTSHVFMVKKDDLISFVVNKVLLKNDSIYIENKIKIYFDDFINEKVDYDNYTNCFEHETSVLLLIDGEIINKEINDLIKVLIACDFLVNIYFIGKTNKYNLTNLPINIINCKIDLKYVLNRKAFDYVFVEGKTVDLVEVKEYIDNNQNYFIIKDNTISEEQNKYKNVLPQSILELTPLFSDERNCCFSFCDFKDDQVYDHFMTFKEKILREKDDFIWIIIAKNIPEELKTDENIDNLILKKYSEYTNYDYLISFCKYNVDFGEKLEASNFYINSYYYNIFEEKKINYKELMDGSVLSKKNLKENIKEVISFFAEVNDK